MLGIELVEGENLDARVAQGRHNFIAPEGIDIGDYARHFLPDQLQLFARRSSVHADFGRTRLNLLPQTCHTNHEELIDIRSENGDEFYSFKKRAIPVLRFLKDTALEG